MGSVEDGVQNLALYFLKTFNNPDRHNSACSSRQICWVCMHVAFPQDGSKFHVDFEPFGYDSCPL